MWDFSSPTRDWTLAPCFVLTYQVWIDIKLQMITWIFCHPSLFLNIKEDQFFSSHLTRSIVYLHRSGESLDLIGSKVGCSALEWQRMNVCRVDRIHIALKFFQNPSVFWTLGWLSLENSSRNYQVLKTRKSSYFWESLYCFGGEVAPHGMWDFSSPTRDQTLAPCFGSPIITTGPPGKSSILLFVNSISFTTNVSFSPPLCPSFLPDLQGPRDLLLWTFYQYAHR